MAGNAVTHGGRQVHLDFHTSQHIPGVAEDFDPEAFADTLAEARVDSVTCFARCHHGYLYYDSVRFPERVHPTLQRRNLLGEQIEACHRRNIRVPVYITVQWDHLTAELHPQWLACDQTGAPVGATGAFSPGFYRKLSLNSPYVAFLRQHTEEVLETLPVDGLFFDIVQVTDDCSVWARQEMQRRGLDPAEPGVRLAFARETLRTFMEEMTQTVRRLNPDCGIFYNSGHVGPGHRPAAASFSHFELESLPSGGWGYQHFPVSARYARTLKRDYLGMTGRFHTSWGDFQSFKNPAALEFECFRMLAMGAGCSIGDQLEPRGSLSDPVYRLIGSVYREVERREPWCREARSCSDVAVLTPEEFQGGSARSLPEATLGANRLLEEGAHQVDIIDSSGDLGAYRLVVMPDAVPVNRDLRSRLDAYLDGGGSLLLSHRSGLTPDGGSFASPRFGVDLVGEAPYSPDFLVANAELEPQLADREVVMYQRGLQVAPRAETQVLAVANVPYFNRTWEHFCSHRHTPSSGQPGYPGILRHGQVIYFMHPVFAQYQANAPRWCKQLVLGAVRLLLPDPLVQHSGPSTLTVHVTRQEAAGRTVVHLLHYIPERRGQDFDVIEDVIALHEVEVTVRPGREIARATCEPQGEELDVQREGDLLRFTVPRVNGHQMVCLAEA